MLARKHALRLEGGNKLRIFLLVVGIVLWSAVTLIGLLYLPEKLKDLGIAGLNGILTSITDLTAVIAKPLFDTLGGLLPIAASLEIVMAVMLVLWVLLLWGWTALLRTRYIYCRTNAGTELYAGKLLQYYYPGVLTVEVAGEDVWPTAWFIDEEMLEPAKPALRVRAKPIAFFGEVLLPEPEAVEEPVAASEEPTAVEEAVTAEETAAVEAPAPVEEREPEIQIIIREAADREAANLAALAAASAAVATAPVAEPAVPAPAPTPEPTPAPAPAPAPVVAPAPASEDGDDSDDEEELGEIREVTVDGKTFRMIIRYSRSFTARVIQAPDFLKAYYSEIKNELMSYNLVKSRISWKHDAFNRGRLQLAKVVVRGKSLCLYLALDPNAYEVEKYHQIDQGNKNAYAKVPMMIRVKSDLGLRKAKFLISEMMENYEIERGDSEDLDYASWYAYRDTKTLIEENLIKELETPEEA